MPTIIDSFLVSLGLENSSFKKGMKETDDLMRKHSVQRTKESNEHAKQSKAMAESYKKIKNEIISLAGAFVSVGAVKGFIATITNSDAALGRLSKNIGVSATDLKAFEGVMKRFQGVAGDADATFRTLARDQSIMKSRGGDPKMMEALARAGVTDISKFYNDATSLQEKWMMLADAFKKLKPADAQMWGQQMGLPESAITAMTEGRNKIEGLVDAQRKLDQMTGGSTKGAQDRADAWNNLVDKLEGLGRSFLDETTPQILDALKSMADNAGITAAAIGGVGLALGAIALLASPFTAIAAAVAAIGVGIMYIASKNSNLNTPPKVNGQPTSKFGYLMGGLPGVYVSGFPQASPAVPLPSGTLPRRGAHSDYNNPGNLEFRGQAGAHRHKGGRFAAFDSVEAGTTALAKQLMRYGDKGIDTIRSIVATYAPKKDHNDEAAYRNFLSKVTGFGLDSRLNLHDPEVLRKMISGHARFEGHQLTAAQIYAGAGQATHTSTVQISNLTINTKATDAKGIARDLGDELRHRAFAAQATRGLQ